MENKKKSEIWREDVILGLEWVLWPYLVTGLIGIACAFCYLVLGETFFSQTV